VGALRLPASVNTLGVEILVNPFEIWVLPFMVAGLKNTVRVVCRGPSKALI
jgi:hypothetical protein